MKYGWIAVVVMMAALFSTGQIAAQDVDEEKPAEGTAAEGTAAEGTAAEPMSELDKLKAMEAESETPTVTGARPVSASTPAKAGEAGMGTEAAERERLRRSMGEVGQSVRQKGEEAIPLKFQFHGYYRTRYNWIGNAPMPKGSTGQGRLGRVPEQERFLRLHAIAPGPRGHLRPQPGSSHRTPSLHDRRVGQRRLRGQRPCVRRSLFAVDQSKTDVNGFDLTESLKLERAWIEFLVPIGQMRVGRMESHWGSGLLTHAGNGLAEWGDFLRGETFDRILFATRPITLARGISKGDTRSTPLLYAFVYDRLSQDPVVSHVISSPPAATNPNFKPFYTTFDTRSTVSAGVSDQPRAAHERDRQRPGLVR